MKKIILGAILALVAVCYFQYRSINSLKSEANRYKENTKTLMQDVGRYRTSDSLNAVKVSTLTLELRELESYRAKDMQLIESLQVKKRELERITSMQMQTIANIKGQVKDSIIYRDKIIRDTIKALSVSDEWIDLHGVVYDDGAFDGTLEVRDSLTVVETVRYRRFLGFLWKTKRVKHRTVDVVNKCPYTHITGLESIVIEQ